MFPTTEIRWFIPGILSKETLSWFSAGHPLEMANVQVHEYLRFSGCDTVGVKFREDRFEIKAKAGVSQPLSLQMGIRGRREQWIKWSLPTKGLPMLGHTLRQSGPWMKVRKERNQRTLSAEAGYLQEVSAETFPVTGCNIELTRIEVEADPSFWFTLAFEAYGPPTITGGILKKGADFFFQGRGRVPGINLNIANSFGYPTWLMNLGKGEKK
jgi:hypothetical protein